MRLDHGSWPIGRISMSTPRRRGRCERIPSAREEQQDICSVSLNLFRQLAIYLAPVLPKLAEQAGELLNDPITQLGSIENAAGRTRVNKFQPLLTRVEPTQVQAMIEETKQANPPSVDSAVEPPVKPGAVGDGPEPLAAEPLAPECTIDDFTKVDLRVARILTAEEVPDAQVAEADAQSGRRCAKERLRRDQKGV